MNIINSRLEELRNEMRDFNVQAVIIPSSDSHQSEYVADYFQSRTWISNFTGSAGTAVVTMDHAGVWTDSRYFLQAEEELSDNEFELHKMVNQFQPGYVTYLADHLETGDVVACDGRLFSKGQIDSFKRILHAKNISLRTDLDLIGEIWNDRPDLPSRPIFEHEVGYAGKTRRQKLDDYRVNFVMDGADMGLLTGLDDIAWIFNLRGSDVESNPVFLAYALIKKKESILFLDISKCSPELVEKLRDENIEIRPYESIIEYLNNLGSDSKIHISLGDISQNIYQAINGKIVSGANHVRNAKAIKNNIELNHVRHAMIKDAVALVRMYRWLEKELETRGVKENEVADQLAVQRKKMDHYIGESFDAIVGFKGNGAIIHYHAQEETSATIQGEGMLLIDSGGQYLDGTTDITRTTYLGTPSEEHKHAFTMVLKGHIALAAAHFPKGTIGIQLDTLARMFLWDERMNYGHGTGHGVGFFMNVHEPPQGFTSGLSTRSKTPIKVGMLTSNEPGFYKTDEYGIRIENLITTVEAGKTEYGEFYKHETLTLFPIELKLIEVTKLSVKEKAWLNSYHQRVYDLLSPLLNDVEKEWLQEKCLPLN